MAYTYTRQSTFSDGDTVTAALFNNEYNQLLNAFAYSSSHANVDMLSVNVFGVLVTPIFGI